MGVDKAPTGIDGFDEVTGGGLPRGRTSLIVGGPGSGKTVFVLQALANGARQWGEPGIFVAFEEPSRQVVGNALTFGWDLPALEENKGLFFLDAQMPADVVSSGAFDLSGLLAMLGAKAGQMGARRIALDSIDVLLAWMDDPLAERREIYRIRDWLARQGLTGLITARIRSSDPFDLPGYGFTQFVADSVVSLSHRVVEQVAPRQLRVVKYRGSGFAENEFPMIIGPSGIQVGVFGAPGDGTGEALYPALDERLSTGIQRLDDMLDGGYYRGASVLVTGAPGTAKSTLSGAFAEAACRRGERVLFVSFDEGPAEMVRNLASVSIDLAPHVLALKAAIDEQEPRCMVIDPLSAMLKTGGEVTVLGVVQRLLALVKSRGITLVCTSMLEGSDPDAEAASIQISTVADTWIHLSYTARGGERNRALSVIKSRGSRHSNQVRELILSDEGITLADVYTSGGEVLMGTLRWEKEAQVAREQEQIQAEVRRMRSELELAQAEATARIEVIQHELEVRRAELAALIAKQQARADEWERGVERVREMRGGGAEDVLS
jgi:circadian clock protein KaiC